ncbi:hypothetical protein DRJ19_03455 [Candidatus Woesearchaeota archaeon]|nr:MAG: hypothetical protein DRJ16_06105 [Candidatus Woesearchaeota archaeon]RLE42807.1 MAG: hypothetical protein DRJ19_03455 [Candidatus Woesearchaeota archaeon]
MPEEKDIVDKIAEEFEKQALEFIESEVFAGSGNEEATEKARETVRAVVAYCIDEAKKHARTPEEFRNEFNTCTNEWFSTITIITNKFLRKTVKKLRKEKS